MACQAEDVTCFTTNVNNSGLCCIVELRGSAKRVANSVLWNAAVLSAAQISTEKLPSQHAQLRVSWEALALIPEKEEETFFRDLFSESVGLLVRVARKACSCSGRCGDMNQFKPIKCRGWSLKFKFQKSARSRLLKAVNEASNPRIIWLGDRKFV